MILVMGAIEDETKKIQESLENIRIHEIFSTQYAIGEYGKQVILLASCGVGKVNASLFTQKLIDMYPIQFILRFGAAGSVAKKVKIGDIIIADECSFHDFDHEILSDFPPYQSYFKTDNELNQKLMKVAAKHQLNLHIGRVLSGDCFVNQKEKAQLIHRNFQALCVEMESAAMAQCAVLNGIPFVCVEYISDMADELADEDYADTQAAIAYQHADFILSFFDELD